MIDSLRIQNFRCFKELELHGLRRINVVVGPNAMGKTALLEAIKIRLVGVPTILTWVAQSRGVFPFVQNPTREQFEGQWSDWFSEFNNSVPIVIWARDSQGQEATLRIFYDTSKAVTIQSFMSGGPTPTSPTTIIPLAFERTHSSGESTTLYATINPQGQLHFEPGRELGPPCAFFWSAMLGAPQENASWFSKLSVAKRENEVIAALQKHFPDIQNLSTETLLPSPSPPAIYADLKYLPKKLPVSLVSAGMNRLLSFILAVIATEKGVVLLDEVENGIFHDQLTRLWDTLVGLARQHDTQIFVTTHSLECLKAAVPLMKEAPDDFCLLRAGKKDMQIHIQMFSGAKLEAALNGGGEVR